jgi:hypothetical protein
MTASEWRLAWAAALDDLEADVTEVEQLLVDDHRVRDLPLANAWTPPDGLGPLPLDLRPRADAVLARQLATAGALALALGTNRRQAAVAARIETGGRGASRPAYVDYAL